MIYYVNGNLLDSNVDYICHQVNCQGVMGSGIAGQIKARWPIVYESYIALCDKREEEIYQMCGGMENGLDWTETLLGEIQLVPVGVDKTVINMFAQQYYGYDGKRYTSYDGFWSCLGKVREQVSMGSKIGFPYHIGCGLGGANWTIIRTMIEVVLDKDFEVYFYNYNGGNNK